jgi:hypothetical protein
LTPFLVSSKHHQKQPNFQLCNNNCNQLNETKHQLLSLSSGGSTLSQSIFASLETRDKNNVDCNSFKQPNKTNTISMNLINSAKNREQPHHHPTSISKLAGDSLPQHHRPTVAVDERLLRPSRHQPEPLCPANQPLPSSPDQRVTLPGRGAGPHADYQPKLSKHHSHFLASPVGYLYERGDR